MAVFNKNTLTQVSGFDNQIIAGELVYQQQTYWNLTLSGVDLTDATIDAQIIRRQLSNVHVGDGWHNNHHANPGNWTTQEKWWELDPCGWIIYLIKKK